MTLSTDGTLVLIGIVAVISPILAELTGRLAIPDVVFELGLGVVIGPAVLRLAHPSSIIVALVPLIVVITTIGVQEGRMRPVNAAALVATGMLSVLLFPMFARMQLRQAPQPSPTKTSPAARPAVVPAHEL
jgi:Kef-type K+ transport system membrane component KefB